MSYLEWARHWFPLVRYNLARGGVLPDSSWPTRFPEFDALTAQDEWQHLRELIGQHTDTPAHQVLPALGATHAAWLALSSLVSHGDEVIVESPGYGPLTVSQAFAQTFFRGEDPLGKRLVIRSKMYGEPERSWQIVGIVADVRNRQTQRTAEPQMYVPTTQQGFRTMTLLVRSSGEPMVLIGPVRKQILSVDATLPFSNPQTMQQVVTRSLGPQRFQLVLLGGFSAMALVLALLGTYGVVSYSVAQRTREFGVRIALGATRSTILRLVLGYALKLALFGVGCGLVAAAAGARVLRSLLFEISETDPLTYAGLAGLLIVVAMFASWVPARRAVGVSPQEALRSD